MPKDKDQLDENVLDDAAKAALLEKTEVDTKDKPTKGAEEEDTEGKASDEDSSKEDKKSDKKEDDKEKKDEKKSMKEDVDAIFAGAESLSEEFKDKAAIIFEAALKLRLDEEIAIIEEAAEAKIEARIAEAVEEITTNLDDFLQSVVTEWKEDNKVAIEAGIKVDLAESLFAGIQNVVKEHALTIDTEKVDLLEAAQKEVEELKASLNASLEEGIAKDKTIRESQIKEVMASLNEGLTDTQKEKLAKLVEDADTSDVAAFTEKATLLKESFFKKSDEEPADKKASASDKTLNESDQRMNKYVQGIKKIKAEK